MSITILGIESSCDDTSASVIRDGVLLSNIIAGQAVHQSYGGVVPELASRAHQQNIIPVVAEAIKRAGIDKSELSAVAFTRGPGLMGSLLVGTSFAKGFSASLGIPMIEINHLQAHVLAHFIKETPDDTDQPTYPFLCLLVSGGNSQIIKVNAYNDMEVIGQTIDDAAGEAFDKVAKMMGLPYPGGPNIAKLAEQGDATAFEFPRPMLHQGLEFSFSGLKTAVSVQMKKLGDENRDADIAASFQEAIVDTLVKKSVKALKQTGLKRLVIAGGVSANTRLRERLEADLAKIRAAVYYAEPALCTDNGAMIAFAGYQRLKAGQQDGLSVTTTPRWPMTELSNPNEA